MTITFLMMGDVKHDTTIFDKKVRAVTQLKARLLCLHVTNANLWSTFREAMWLYRFFTHPSYQHIRCGE